MLVALAIVKRPRAYAARRPVASLTAAPLTAAPLALQSLLTLAIRARPYATLAVAMAAGFLATRANTRKEIGTPSGAFKDSSSNSHLLLRIQTMDAQFFMLPAMDRLVDGAQCHAALI